MTGWRSGRGSKPTLRPTGAFHSTSGASSATTKSWMPDRHSPASLPRRRQRTACAGKSGSLLPLSERVQAGERDLLVFVGLHTGHADGANAFVLVHDRQRALDQHAGRKARKCRPVLHPILEELARTLGQRRRSGLADGYFGGDRAGAVHALEAEQGGAFIDDGDRHIPPVLDGFGLARLENLLHIGQGQARLGSHDHSYGGNLLYAF